MPIAPRFSAGPSFDGDAAGAQVIDDLLRRRLGQEAEVVAAGRHRLAGEPYLLCWRMVGRRLIFCRPNFIARHVARAACCQSSRIMPSTRSYQAAATFDVADIHDEVIEGFDDDSHGSLLAQHQVGERQRRRGDQHETAEMRTAQRHEIAEAGRGEQDDGDDAEQLIAALELARPARRCRERPTTSDGM